MFCGCTHFYKMFTFVFCIFRILALFLIPGSLGLLDLEELANIQYAIDILDKPLLINENSEKDGVVLSSKYGQLYWCQYESISSGDNNGQESDNAAKTEVVDLLNPMADGPCLVLNTGWWTYELCYKKEIRQYHLEEGKIAGDIISLGHYASEFNWNDINLKSKPEYAGRYHSQEYTNGSVCDLTGDLRSTSVRLKCHNDITDELVSVEEPATCTYIVTVHTHKICQHPELKILSQKKSVPITCQPLLNDEEYAHYNEFHPKHAAPDTAGHPVDTVPKPDGESTTVQPGTSSARKESIFIMAEAPDDVIGKGEDFKRVLVGTIVKKLKNSLVTEEEEQEEEEQEQEQKKEKEEPLHLQENEKQQKEEELIVTDAKKEQKQESTKLGKMTDASDELNDALNGFLSVVSSELKTLVAKTDEEDEDEEEEEDEEEIVNTGDTTKRDDAISNKDPETSDSDNTEAADQTEKADGKTSDKSTVTDQSYITWQGQGNQVQQITIDTGMRVKVRQLQKENREKEDEKTDSANSDENNLAKTKSSTPPSRKVEVRIINAAYYNKGGKAVSIYTDETNPSIERMVIALLQRNDDEVAEFERQKQLEANYRFQWSKTKEKKSTKSTMND